MFRSGRRRDTHVHLGARITGKSSPVCSLDDALERQGAGPRRSARCHAPAALGGSSRASEKVAVSRTVLPNIWTAVGFPTRKRSLPPATENSYVEAPGSGFHVERLCAAAETGRRVAGSPGGGPSDPRRRLGGSVSGTADSLCGTSVVIGRRTGEPSFVISAGFALAASSRSFMDLSSVGCRGPQLPCFTTVAKHRAATLSRAHRD